MSEQTLEFWERVRRNPRPVVVDFWAPWCGPCRMIEPSLTRLQQEFHDQVDVWRINADEYPELLRDLNIYGIPTLIGFHGGEEVVRQTGAVPLENLRRLFQAAQHGERITAPPLSTFDRLVRLAAGAAILLLAYQRGLDGFNWALVAVGVVILFSAVHDRCPLWQAIISRLRRR